MKLKLFVKLSFLAISLGASTSWSALVYTTDGLYLGFRQIGNSTSDFAVNIGNGATYRDALSPITLTLTGLTTTLNGIFGTGWAANPNVLWGAIGTTHTTSTLPGGDLPRVVYVSEPLLGSAPVNASSQSTITTAVDGFRRYYSGLGNPALTEAGVTNSAIGSPGNASSWTSSLASGPFASSNLQTIETPASVGLSFYRVPLTTQGSVANLGTFTLAGDVVTFTPVPEPSTYALVGGALVALGLVARNRRKLASASL